MDEQRAAVMRERHEKHIERLVKEACDRGFTEEEVRGFHIGDLSKQTQSKRIRRMITLAYYKGMCRGVKDCVELFHTPIHFR